MNNIQFGGEIKIWWYNICQPIQYIIIEEPLQAISARHLADDYVPIYGSPWLFLIWKTFATATISNRKMIRSSQHWEELCTTQESILQNLLVFIKTYIYIFQSFMHVNKFRFNIDIFNVIFVCFQILEVYWSSMRKR